MFNWSEIANGAETFFSFIPGVGDGNAWENADLAWKMFVDDVSNFGNNVVKTVDEGLTDFGGFVVGAVTGETNEYGDRFVDNITGFWTGHNMLSEQNVTTNIDKANLVMETLKYTHNTIVENAREEVRKAMRELNNVSGLNEYVINSLDVNYFDSAFDSINEGIEYIATQLRTNVDNILSYSNSSGGEKFAASVGNIAAKFEEGFFKVFESIDDALMMGAGVVVSGTFRFFGNENGAQAVEEFCGGVVAQNAVHDFIQEHCYDLFDDFAAVQSASALGTTSELVGAIAGYTYISGAAGIVAYGSASAGNVAATKTASELMGEVVAQVGPVKISEGTIINTVLTGATTFGGSASMRLNEGETFQEAATGAKADAIVMSTAVFGMGVIGDNADELKEAFNKGKKATDNADDAANAAANQFDDAAKAATDQADDAAKAAANQADDAAKVAQEERAFTTPEENYQKAVKDHQDLIRNGGSEEEIQASLKNIEQAEARLKAATNQADDVAKAAANQADDAAKAAANQTDDAVKVAQEERAFTTPEENYQKAVKDHQDLIRNGGSEEEIQASLKNIEQAEARLKAATNQADDAAKAAANQADDTAKAAQANGIAPNDKEKAIRVIDNSSNNKELAINKPDDAVKEAAKKVDDAVKATSNQTDDVVKAAANQADDAAKAAANQADDAAKAAANQTDDAVKVAQEERAFTTPEENYQKAVKDHQDLIRNGGSEEEIQASLKNIEQAEARLKAATNQADDVAKAAANQADDAAKKVVDDLGGNSKEVINNADDGIANAKANLKEAENELNAAKNTGRTVEIEEAQLKYDRVRTEYEDTLAKAASKQADEALASAEANLKDAANELNVAKNTGRTIEIEEAQLKYNRALAEYEDVGGTIANAGKVVANQADDTARAAQVVANQADDAARASVTIPTRTIPVTHVSNTGASAVGHAAQNTANGIINTANTHGSENMAAMNKSTPIDNLKDTIDHITTPDTTPSRVVIEKLTEPDTTGPISTDNGDNSDSGSGSNGDIDSGTGTGKNINMWENGGPTDNGDNSDSGTGTGKYINMWENGGPTDNGDRKMPSIETTSTPTTEATTERITEIITQPTTETTTTPTPDTTPSTTGPVPSTGTSYHGGGSNGGGSNGGGGYYYSNNNNDTTTPATEIPTTTELEDDIIKKGRTYDLPTSTKNQTTPTTTPTANKGNSVIPVLAGLGAAAAAGIGAKAYIDRKNNRANDEEPEDFKAEDWSNNNDINIEYQEPAAQKEETLDFDDNGYELEEPEKYGARNHQELEDLQ